MRKRWNICFVVALLIVISLSMSACVQSDNKGKPNSETNNEQTEDNKIPTLDEVLEQQEDNEDVSDDVEEYQDDTYENTHIEEPSSEEFYEEEP